MTELHRILQVTTVKAACQHKPLWNGYWIVSTEVVRDKGDIGLPFLYFSMLEE
jgi:hypothetical protein